MYIHSSDWSIKRVRSSLLIFLILFIIVIIIIVIITLYIVASQAYSATKKTMSEMLFLPNHAPEIHSPNCSVYCCLRSKNCVGLDFPGIVIDLIWANSGRLNLKTTHEETEKCVYYFVLSPITGVPKQFLLLSTYGAVANTCIVLKYLQYMYTTLK